ncbi:hypothetical protein M8J75_004413 [Diaphorina citri]|nr:hypothetical protein M8J75_004413 [Diaphorina citri]
MGDLSPWVIVNVSIIYSVTIVQWVTWDFAIIVECVIVNVGVIYSLLVVMVMWVTVYVVLTMFSIAWFSVVCGLIVLVWVTVIELDFVFMLHFNVFRFEYGIFTSIGDLLIMLN